MFAGLNGFGILPNQQKMLLKRWAMIRPKLKNSQSLAREILLMAQIFVADNEQIKICRLRHP